MNLIPLHVRVAVIFTDSSFPTWLSLLKQTGPPKTSAVVVMNAHTSAGNQKYALDRNKCNVKHINVLGNIFIYNF